MNQDVKIDREGLQNTKTGERSTMILPSELEVSLDFNGQIWVYSTKKCLGKAMEEWYIKRFLSLVVCQSLLR